MHQHTFQEFALEGLTQSLRYELAQFGIKVTIIEPGAISTNVAANNMHVPKKIQGHSTEPLPFAEMTKNIMKKSKEVVAKGSPPRVVADVVLKAANSEKLECRYRAGSDAEKLFDVRTKMSDAEFEEFLYKLLIL